MELGRATIMPLTLTSTLSALGFRSVSDIDVDFQNEASIMVTGGIDFGGPEISLEAALRKIPADFDRMPILFEGHSKSVRLWTDQIVAIRFKPTMYSYTMNRYGEVPGTDSIRLKFTASLFRRISLLAPRNGIPLRTAFVAEIESPVGPLLIQRRI